jgi:copper chaperone NosL
MKKMSLPSRIIVAIASLGLLITLFFPVWFIFLVAPQYPEGLTMQIWLARITGQVDIINGLNHYIGMKHIKAEMFPEFGFLPYIVCFFTAFGLLVAATGNRKLLFSYIILTVLGGAAAMGDFYKWGYDYGHNLDPKAPIQVPGLSYQPPLFGHKTLLNFDAYSYPDVGGWIVVGVGLIFFLVWFWEWRRDRKRNIRLSSVTTKAALASLAIVALHSCSVKPAPFQYGKDLCDDCKMTVMDPKFGGEILTKKGRVFKFDDAHCLSHYIKSGNLKPEDIAQTVFVDYNNKQNFLDVKSSYFVVSPQLKSPMNSNAAAFASKEKAVAKAAATAGQVKTWDEVFNEQH